MADIQEFACNSSAAATPNSNYNYDVFVVYYGPDVKKTLASHLYHRLLLDGFRVCLDEQEMQEKDTLSSQIKRATEKDTYEQEMQEKDTLSSQIKRATATTSVHIPFFSPRRATATTSVHIPIFSPKFAESKRCMEKLVLMLESGTTIVPVFYLVNPSDLRISKDKGKDGEVGRALLDLVRNSRNETNKYTVWIEDLLRVADKSGLDLEACKGDEGELVDRVVQLVEEKVIETQLLAAYPIGLDDKLQDFENKVLLRRQQQGVQTAIVGIVGSPGVGKTTIAMEFFKRKRSNYSRSCFLSDVGEAAGRNSLPSLQNQLIKDLTSLDLEIINVTDGKEKVSRYLSCSQALVILDGIDHAEQLLAFFSRGNDLCSGSLILVTSRNRTVLLESGIDDLSTYDLTGLSERHSQELFCLHAFHKRLPVLGFEAVVTQFLSVCEGLPLSLKLLGALVYQKDLDYCETQLREISKILRRGIEDTLKICYDSLDEQEKNTFLDIACFFINEDRGKAITIWDACGWEGRLNLENLQHNFLVEIDSKNCIRMNDLLINLGRDLAEKDRFNCRLWRPTDNLAFHNAFLQSTVRGVNMVHAGGPNPGNLNNSFVDSRLRLLRAEGDCLGSIWNHLAHSDILWLCWNSYPFTNLPSCNPIRNLRVLQVAGDKLKNLWMDDETPLELRELYIGADVLRFPKSIGQLGHLQKIEAKAIIGPLPEEFVHLRSLKYLSLRTRSANLQRRRNRGNPRPRWLPDSFGELTILEHLDLFGRSHLQKLPDSFGELTNLEHLDLSGCSHLQKLPASFGNLRNLSHLDLSGCSHLETLPEPFGELSHLQHLDMSGCSRLKMLPKSFGNLTNLRHLELSGCSGLRWSTDMLDNLRNLPHLDLSKVF